MVKKALILIACFVIHFACKSKKETPHATKSTSSESNIVASDNSNPPEGINIGNKIPNIVLNSLNDSVIELYAIKNKLVIVDFWASWCGPCRKENPNLVKAYNTYKDVKFKGNCNGLTLFSVSLDRDKNRWQQAITDDKLIWPYHVSDLKMWDSEVVSKFGITSIPTNIIINGNGIIVAKNLTEHKLITWLEKYKEQP